MARTPRKLISTHISAPTTGRVSLPAPATLPDRADMERGANFKKALIDAVRARPVLYDGNRRDYKNPVHTAAAWHDVAQAVGATVMECEAAFQGLRNRFTHERKRRLRAANEPALQHGNPWHLYDDIAWLGDYVKMRDRRPGKGADFEPLPTQAAYFPDSLIHLDLANQLGKEADTSGTSNGFKDEDDSTPHTPTSSTHDSPGVSAHHDALPVMKAWSSLLGGASLKRSLDASYASAKRPRDEEEEDEDVLFGRVIGKTLQRLSPFARAKAKADIQKLLLEAEFDANHQPSPSN